VIYKFDRKRIYAYHHIRGMWNGPSTNVSGTVLHCKSINHRTSNYFRIIGKLHHKRDGGNINCLVGPFHLRSNVGDILQGYISVTQIKVLFCVNNTNRYYIYKVPYLFLMSIF
jgi:hypothetical protein